ncbi:MAG: hypothetical protein AB9919_04345 [Geobacteraceae bacterium]|jgi:hypothetical protein
MSYYVTVRIWEPVREQGRAARYELPLSSVLRSYKLGEVIDRGTVMSRELEVEYVEFELVLVNAGEAVDLVKRVFEEAGAPAGSEIRINGGSAQEVITFGRKEGLAIYLDGIGLPDAVYETCTADGLAGRIYGVVTSQGGEIRGSWVGPTETAIYLYVPDAEKLFAGLEPILADYPLCGNARVVIRHGNPALQPRTVRMPPPHAAATEAVG